MTSAAWNASTEEETKESIAELYLKVLRENAALKDGVRALRAEASAMEEDYDEMKAKLADRDNHIEESYKALGDVNRSIHLFDYIRKLRDNRADAVKMLENIRDQVVGGKLCFYGDRTGFEPQFTFIQTQHWEEILENAKETMK